MWISIAIISFLYIWYLNIILRKNKALEALSNIDVHLKKRFDLIPNILKMAQKFMDHESKLFHEITSLRTEVLKPYNPENPKAVQEHFAAADQLFRKMSDFGIHCEAYPDLKSSETMVTAMQTYNETEGQLSASRRFYNSAAARLNTSIEIFPGSLLSSLIGVQSMPSFQAENKAKDSIDVHDFLK